MERMPAERQRRTKCRLRPIVLGLIGVGTYAGCAADSKQLDPLNGDPNPTGGSHAQVAGGGRAERGGSGGVIAKGGTQTAGESGATAGGHGGETGSGETDAAGDGGETGERGGAPEGGTTNVSGGVSGNTGAAGEAGVACESGLVTCPGSPSCETNLQVGNPSGDTVANCGACGLTCSLDHATNTSCAKGSCVPVCSAGFASCNGPTVNDGCESDLNAPATCGSCGHACSLTGTASTACTDRKCAPTCAPGFADCNLDDGTRADDGCEVYLDALDRCATACTGGTACSPRSVCNAGSCISPQGLVVLTIPFTAPSQTQRYADKFSLLPNLTNATLTLRAYAPEAKGGSFNVYITDSDLTFGQIFTSSLTTLSQRWTDIKVPVGGASGNFDPSQVYQVTIDIMSGTDRFSSPTRIYVDRIWSSNSAVSDSFDANCGQWVASSLQTVAGSTFSWTDAMPISGSGGQGGSNAEQSGSGGQGGTNAGQGGSGEQGG